MKLGEPVELQIHTIVLAVYRLWNAQDECLYVGQAAREHPLMRVMDHRRKPWWPEVARADYVTVNLPEHLTSAEMAQIQKLNPKYNVYRPLAA